MPKFLEITYEGTTRGGQGKPYIVAKDDQGREVAIFNEKSLKRVKDAIGAEGDYEGPGEIRENGTGPNGQQRWSWEHPEDVQPRGNVGGRPPRDPVAELVGIAHHQALAIVFSSRPPEDPESLSNFWKKARPHIRAMAKDIAEDRLNLRLEMSPK